MTHFITFRSKSKKELENIYEDIIDLDDQDWHDVYNYATQEQYNFLYVVCNSNPQQYYHNFDERLI